MPDTRLHDIPEPANYRITRKGSRYNIFGPQGRIFTKCQSASVAGPRWEELTHTPWPFDSTAYERGHRLWELGLINRDQIGKRNIVITPRQKNSESAKQKPKRVGCKVQLNPSVNPVRITITVSPLALPTPTIDLEQHQRLMTALRQNPALLFTSPIQQALQHEVEYHRPQARWAAHLLKLLARYEQRQRTQQRMKSDSDITAKHIEWQAERMEAGVAV